MEGLDEIVNKCLILLLERPLSKKELTKLVYGTNKDFDITRLTKEVINQEPNKELFLRWRDIYDHRKRNIDINLDLILKSWASKRKRILSFRKLVNLTQIKKIIKENRMQLFDTNILKEFFYITIQIDKDSWKGIKVRKGIIKKSITIERRPSKNGIKKGKKKFMISFWNLPSIYGILDIIIFYTYCIGRADKETMDIRNLIKSSILERIRKKFSNTTIAQFEIDYHEQRYFAKLQESLKKKYKENYSVVFFNSFGIYVANIMGILHNQLFIRKKIKDLEWIVNEARKLKKENKNDTSVSINLEDALNISNTATEIQSIFN